MKQFDITLPPQVWEAIERLERAGFGAFAVGGCVRDTVLGRQPNDWDITTSARPEQTAAVFADCRTIETGIRHGTLTVLLDGMPLEITTYRRDGAYADNRHPVSVSFSTSVEDDLSRRDFTVNAMAYHPERGIVDLFGGTADLARRVIACVGDPVTRFSEDGLRILRAIRFASVLDFSIDEATACAIHECRHLLSNIAAERIREEFCKLIQGKGAVRILRTYSDVICEFIPELADCIGFDQKTPYHCYDVYEHTLHALEQTDGDLITRLAIFFHDIGKPHVSVEDGEVRHFPRHAAFGTELTQKILHRLRFDNETIAAVVRLVEYHDRDISAEPRAVKRLMQKLSDENILRLMELRRCDRLAHAEGFSTPSPSVYEIPRIMKQIRDADECLSLKTLRIGGDDLIGLGWKAGKDIGRVLHALLEDVIEGRLPNDRDALLRAAEEKKRDE